jgi:hypothetical protein
VGTTALMVVGFALLFVAIKIFFWTLLGLGRAFAMKGNLVPK